MVKVIDVIKGSPAFRAGIRRATALSPLTAGCLDMLDIIYADSEELSIT